MKLSPAMCLVLLVFLATVAAALNCYKCSDCGDRIGDTHTCDSIYDRCMVLNVTGKNGTYIKKLCNVKATCDLVRNNTSNALEDLLDDEGNEISEDMLKKTTVKCCEGDYCNSATTSLINPLLLLLPTLMFFLRF